MNNNKHSRKQFFKKIGLTLTGAGIAATSFGSYTNDNDLIDEQKEFLLEYQNWLTEFHSFVKLRSESPMNIENNKRLMELSAESDKRKTTLELYMKDKKFVKYFNEITREITESI